jgi:hypothetical protein
VLLPASIHRAVNPQHRTMGLWCGVALCCCGTSKVLKDLSLAPLWMWHVHCSDERTNHGIDGQTNR